MFGISIVWADSSAKADFETIKKGWLSNPELGGAQTLIEIYNNQEWSEFWVKYFKHFRVVSVAPAVDFENYMVLVALDNTRGGGGYSIEIKEVTMGSSSGERPFNVVLELHQPGSGAMTTMAMTRPIHIVKVRK